MDRYPEFVKKGGVRCYPENEEYRYYLDISFEGSVGLGKTAMIMMQNPSKAREKESDRTVNKVLNYLHDFGYGRVIITNMIPFYGKDIATVLDKCDGNEHIYNRNFDIIKEYGIKADKVFAAWGWIYPKQKISKESRKNLRDRYQAEIDKIKEYFQTIDKNLYCYCINRGNKRPKHPLYWAKGKKEEDFEIYQ